MSAGAVHARPLAPLAVTIRLRSVLDGGNQASMLRRPVPWRAASYCRHSDDRRGAAQQPAPGDVSRRDPQSLRRMVSSAALISGGAGLHAATPGAARGAGRWCWRRRADGLSCRSESACAAPEAAAGASPVRCRNGETVNRADMQRPRSEPAQCALRKRSAEPAVQPARVRDIQPGA